MKNVDSRYAFRSEGSNDFCLKSLTFISRKGLWF
jgi:hypothetical protein